ncbi:MAG: ImmA/IrrE family metallo-endopeptidase [Spirochaetaceae bacterium]|mgnify:CR=1 FL=1|nr:ImmA/IrrE family metallo-endopeptidase [Spirochaetaceae bacterium]
MYTRETIDKVADIVRKYLNFDTPAYNPLTAVELLEGSVVYDVFDECIDAYIEKTQNDDSKKFIIHLNANKPFSRTRFSLAHELGHLFLHMGFLTDRWNNAETFNDSIYFRTIYRKDNNYSEEESEANEFAAAFLMPTEQFKKEVFSCTSNGEIDFYTISSKFEVSEQAAMNRARFLGITGW